MRQRDEELSSKWGTICTPFQMLAPDRKMRKTQAANVEGILRIIQSISSPKAGPFKILLAKVGAALYDSGVRDGEALGETRGIAIGEQKGKIQVYYFEMSLTPEEIAEKMQLPVEDVNI